MTTSAAATFGTLLAVTAGIMNGVSMLPMRYLGKWEWENVWLAFILIGCVFLPFTIVCFTVSAPVALLILAPATATAAAVICGAL